MFAEGNNLSLPISISGLRFRDRNGRYSVDYYSNSRKCAPCEETAHLCQQDIVFDDQCHCYNFTLYHTIEILYARSLAFTFTREINRLLPSWLRISIDLAFTLHHAPLGTYDLIAPITQNIGSVEGCRKLTTFGNGIYSVLRYDKTLSVTIDGIQYDYIENNDTGSTNDPMCFAVEICQGLDSPVHMQISKAIHEILLSQYLQIFTIRQWTLYLNTVSVFKTPVQYNGMTSFWNGVHMILISDIRADVCITMDSRLDFKIGPFVFMTLKFSGTAYMNYMVSGILIIDVFLTILSPHRRNLEC